MRHLTFSFRAAFLLLITVFTAQAQNAWNKTGTAAWNVPGNWSDNAVPGAGTFALIATGGTSVIGVGVSATARNVLVGRNSGGTLLIDGGYLKTIWTVTIGQNFGGSGVGVVAVQNGGVLDAGGAGLPGFPAEIEVGTGGSAGYLYVLPGGTVNANSIKVGDTGGGVGGTMYMFGTLNVTETANATLWVGWENPGIYYQYSGTATLRQITVGAGPVTGTATMSGGTMDSQIMIIGDRGTGTFLQLGGLVRASEYVTFGLQGGSGTLHLAGGVLEASLFEELGGSGRILLNGGTLRALKNESNFMRGFESGNVTLEAELGGSFIDTNGYSIGIAAPLTGGGRLTKVGNGLLTLSGFNGYTGGTTVRSGTLAVSGSGAFIIHDNASLIVGQVASDNAVLEIGDDTGVLSRSSIIGDQAGSVGRVTVNGAWTDFTTILVGNYGSGTLDVLDGYAGSSGGILLGVYSGGQGNATVTNGTLQTYGSFTVGNAGAGTLLINSGLAAGMDSDADIRLGGLAGGSGIVTVNGGTMTTPSAIHVGVAGRGSLLLNGGYISSGAAAMGVSTGGSGTATVTSGTWAISDGLTVGAQGSGALNVNGGLVSVSGTTTVAAAATTGSIFLTNTSGTAGVLTTRRVTEGSGAGSVNFNGGILRALANESAFISGFEDGDLTTTGAGATIDSGTFAIGIGSGFSGTGGLTKLGAGTLTMAGLSTYSGSTSVTGKLVFNGTNTGNSAVTIQSGAELAGTGRFSGQVTISNGAILSPGNSPGTITMGSLILNNTSDVRFELGTVSDLVVVTSGLTLDGLLTVTAGSGFDEGSYTLFQYGGALTNNGLNLTSMPAGFYYSLDFSQIGFVNLVVEDAQYWDGSNTSPNGTVNGGSGTWNNSTTNWTVVNGSANFGWSGSSVAVFSGSAGVVTVAETISVAAMDFVTDGYLLTGTGALAISGTSLGVNVGSAVTAEIGTQITGAGTLVKTGVGTLALTGSNNYSGGTTVKSGTLAVSGAGARINHGSAAMIIGDASGDSGALQIVGGGLVSNSVGGLGNAVGSSGSATVTSGTWANSGDLVVGNFGSGNLLVNGGRVSNAAGIIASSAGSSGSATITSGTWASSGALYVGLGGTGNLLINGGYLSHQSGYIGMYAGSTGSATITSGTWANPFSLLYVGVEGTGSLLVDGGSIFNTVGAIGLGASGIGTATVTSGTWHSVSGFFIGYEGTGSLLVNGGLFSVEGTTFTGYEAGSVGTITLTSGTLSTNQVAELSGSGTITFNGGVLQARRSENDFVSGYEAGDVVIQAGGAFIDSGAFSIGISSVLSGSGALTKLGSGPTTLTAANTYTGGTTISAGLLQIGTGGTTGSVAGNILNNAELSFYRSDALAYGGVISGTGNFTKRGGGTLTLTGSSSYTGNTTVRSGTLVIDGGSLNHPGQYVSIGHPEGSGFLEIINGGRITSSSGNIGNSTATVGGATVTSGTWTISGGLGVGIFGAGNLLINGGLVSSDSSSIGNSATANGVATISSGTWALASANDFAVGNSGTGTLNLTNTGVVRVGGGTGTVTIGKNAGSTGAVNIGTGGAAGSLLAATVTSGSGAGVVNFNHTGTVNFATAIGGSLAVNKLGAGTTILTGSNTHAGTTTISAGILQVGNGGTIGSISGNIANNASLIFNRSNAFTYGGEISGTGGLTKLGSGTTALTGANTYSGTTGVQAGKLLVNGVNSGTGAVNVAGGAALGGSGTIAGVVTVANGGILAPGNGTGTLTVGGLILNSTSDLQFELGTTSDLVVVQGGLTLDGILNVTDSGGFDGGSYTLFQYAPGMLVNNGLSFGTLPAGFLYALDLSTDGYVRLSVATPDEYWDGSNTTPNGTVNGGSGTWNNSLTNWTSASGSANFAWNSSGTAIFSGTAGTVDVVETINVADMVFETDGYALTGTGALAISGSTLTVNTGSGVTTGIATQITGSGALVKTGTDGTLILTGSNSYLGDANGLATVVRSGTLAVQAGGIINHELAEVTVGWMPGDSGVFVIGSGGRVESEDGFLGFGAGSTGVALVDGGTWNAGGDLVVGQGGTGTLTIQNGGRISSNNGYVGAGQGSLGTAVVDGGVWNNTLAMIVGSLGTGTLTIQNNGLVTSRTGYIGVATAITATVNVTSGTWQIASGHPFTNSLFVGQYGTGTLNIGSSGMVTSSGASIGDQAGSSGTVNVTGGTWNSTSFISIGNSGTGALNITNGGLVSNTFGIIGYGAAGTVLVDGGTWNTSADLFVGELDAGTLTIQGGGVVSVSGTAMVADDAIATGTLNIGAYDLLAPTTGGTLDTAIFYFGDGASALNFNQTDAVTFGANIASYSGSHSISQRGSGTTTFTGSNSYTGATTISAGKLVINGVNTGTGAFLVQSGGALGGSGSIAGTVTVEDGGLFAPGTSPETINVGGLVLNNASQLTYELDTPGISGSGVNDLTIVTNDLVLDGILNITPLGGFAAGTYYLFEYGGSLSNNGLVFGDVSGLYDYEIDFSTSGQVNLDVTAALAQYWDGSNIVPDGTVSGGSGTWNNVLTNWTGASGNANSNWEGVLPAIFSGTAGTVTVADTINVAEIRFVTDGYVLDGTGALAISGTALTLRSDVAVSADIGVEISGTGAVVKTGGGTVILSGSSSFSGGTQLNSGTLLVDDDNALGGGTLTLGDATTFGVVSGGNVALANNVTVAGDVNISTASFGFLEIDGVVGLGATRTLTFIEDFSDVRLTGEITGAGGLNLVMSGSGLSGTVTFSGSDSNSYAGLTTVGNGVELSLEKDPGATAIAGNLQINAGGEVTLFDTSEQINPASTVTINGILGILAISGTTTQTIGSLQGTGAIINTFGPSVLDVKAGNFAGSILDGGADPLALIKSGPGTLVLSNANAYRGGTTITAGRLQTTDSSALGSGAVALNGGILAPTGQLDVGSSFNWQGGQLALAPVAGDIVNVATALTNGGNGGAFLLDAAGITKTTYTLMTFGTTDFVAGDFSALFDGLNPNVQFQTQFVVTNPINGEVQLTITGATATGAILQNSAPVNIPTFADFFVNGPVTTGSANESNTINSLTFADGSSLQVFNNLTVTSGDFTVPTGSAAINGSNVIVPGDFNLDGAGILIAGSNFAIAGDANVNGGSLVINGLFAASGNMNVNSALIVNGVGDFGGLNANRGMVTVNGLLDIGGSANLNNGSNLLVNSGGVMNVGVATNINFGSNAIINGTLTSPVVNVNDGGLLKGNGLIVGDVFNNGVVAPGTSPGVLTIDGNYTQGNNGTLEIESGDFLSVSGHAALDGTLAYSGGGLKYGQQIAFLGAGSISGEFDEILMPNPSKNRGRLLIEGGTGILLVAPTSYTLVAETQNQKNVAKALDSFITQTGNDQETVSIALDLQSEEQYPAAFDQISPAFHESLADITIEQANAQNQNLAQRASALRLGARGFQAIGIEAPLMHDKDGKSVMDAKDGKDILSPAPDNKWGVWVQGNGVFARATNASQVPNYNFESGGFLAGADYRWSESFVTGLYAGYQGTYAKYTNGGNTTINSVQFGGYASYDNGGFYADGIVGGGYSAYKVKRPIQFSTVDRTASSRPDGGQLSTYLGLGYDWEVGNFTIGPILSGQYTYAGIAPFTENGADSLNLSVGQQNANSLRTNLGGRIAYTWKLTDSITLIPEGRMFWQHEFLENPRNIEASLEGGNGPSFGYTTSTPDRDAVFAGAGIIGQFGPNWNAYFYYNADFGRQDYISHAISTGLNFKF